MVTTRTASVRCALVFGAIFVADCIVNSIGIGFPITWHPDEQSKALQIQTGTLNFYHPYLLLLLTKVATVLLHLDDTARAIVLTGRFVSVAATSAAVTILAIVVARRFGVLFGLIAAILIGITPTVFVNAHFFKEDALLLFGCSLVLLALQTFDLRPTPKNAILLGIAVGIACSAKYVGVLMVIPLIILIARKPSASRNALIACGSAASVFAIVNAVGIVGGSSLINGIAFELRHVTSSHFGVQFGPTSSENLHLLSRSTSLGLVFLWLSGLAYCCWSAVSAQRGEFRYHQFSLFEVTLYLAPLLFLIAIQMSMVVLARYLLPVAAMVTLAAVWTVARIVTDGRTKIAGVAAAVLLVVSALGTLNSFVASASVFVDPPRARVARWISANLPHTAKVAAEFYSGIPDRKYTELDPTLPSMPVSVEIINVGDSFSIESLRAAGFTHFVTSEGSYARLFNPNGKIIWAATEDLKRNYEQVFAKLKLVYEQPARSDLDAVFDARVAVYDLGLNGSLPAQK